MATVTLILKANKVDNKGEMPIYLRIIKGRKTKFIALGQKVHPTQWDEAKLRVKKSFPNSARVNAFLASKVSEAENIAVTMETKENYVSSKKIKESILGKNPESFIKYAEQYLQELKDKGKMGTKDKVNATLYKLKEYLKNKDIMFDEIDVHFLKKYEHYLRHTLGNKINTIHSNLKIFRKIFNDAIREELIEAHLNPFLRFKLTTEKTKKEFLTEEEIKAIEDLALNENTVMNHHRNMYVFACYAGGIRISDTLLLRWQNYDGTHITFFTQKTKETIPVKLPVKAIEIIEKYASLQPERKPTDFIFPFLKNNVDYTDPQLLFNAISSNTAYVNKNLKTLGEKAKIEKHISFHSSRHSWATRALRKGMRIEHVSKLMGHANIKTTQIYAKIVSSDLDNAMSVFND